MNRRDFIKNTAIAVTVPIACSAKTAVARSTDIPAPDSYDHALLRCDVLSKEYKGNLGVIVCSDFHEMSYIIDRFRCLCNIASKQMIHHKQVSYPNGSKILFTTSKQEDVDCLRSVNAGWLCFTTYGKLSNSTEQVLRCRLRRKDVPHSIIYT